MGKRKKKSQNVVKLDLREAVPLLVQQSSKDGRRVEQSVHNIPTPQIHPPPPTFDPSPLFATAEDCVFPEVCDSTGELSSTEHVRLCSLSSRCILTVPPLS